MGSTSRERGPVINSSIAHLPQSITKTTPNDTSMFGSERKKDWTTQNDNPHQEWQWKSLHSPRCQKVHGKLLCKRNQTGRCLWVIWITWCRTQRSLCFYAGGPNVSSSVVELLITNRFAASALQIIRVMTLWHKKTLLTICNVLTNVLFPKP